MLRRRVASRRSAIGAVAETEPNETTREQQKKTGKKNIKNRRGRKGGGGGKKGNGALIADSAPTSASRRPSSDAVDIHGVAEATPFECDPRPIALRLLDFPRFGLFFFSLLFFFIMRRLSYRFFPFLFFLVLTLFFFCFVRWDLLAGLALTGFDRFWKPRFTGPTDFEKFEYWFGGNSIFIGFYWI